MTKDSEHEPSDRYGRGRAAPKKGVGAYTTDKPFKPGDDIGADHPGKIDRSNTPNEKPYGSMHYPSKAR